MKHTAYLVDERVFIKDFHPYYNDFSITKYQHEALAMPIREWLWKGVNFEDRKAGKDALDPVRGKGSIYLHRVVVSYYDPEGDMSEDPLFTHDCNNCKFLGTYCCPDNLKWCDLYFCVQLAGMPTVIARFGNEGSNYSSGIGFADGSIPSLTEAKIRAIAKGLLPVE